MSRDEASDCSTFCYAINSAASTCLGSAVQPNREWITNSSWLLIEKKKLAKLQGQVEDYKLLTKQCRSQLRKDVGKMIWQQRESGRYRMVK